MVTGALEVLPGGETGSPMTLNPHLDESMNCQMWIGTMGSMDMVG